MILIIGLMLAAKVAMVAFTSGAFTVRIGGGK